MITNHLLEALHLGEFLSGLTVGVDFPLDQVDDQSYKGEADADPLGDPRPLKAVSNEGREEHEGDPGDGWPEILERLEPCDLGVVCATKPERGQEGASQVEGVPPARHDGEGLLVVRNEAVAEDT